MSRERLICLVLLGILARSCQGVLSPTKPAEVVSLNQNEHLVAPPSMFKIDEGISRWQTKTASLSLPFLVSLADDDDRSAAAQPVYNLLARLLGPTAGANFTITIQSDATPTPAECEQPQHDWGFIETSTPGQVSITANNALAASWALGHYLKYYANLHVSWSGAQLYIPEQWPTVRSPSSTTSNYCLKKLDRLQYYQNVCTLSYSMVWWTWERWEQELDFMALNGINFALAFVGQEELFYQTFLEFGATDADVEKFFSGPAFLAWNRMGNLQEWGGPLPRTWSLEQLALQKRILQRMKELNIIPIMPAFAGHVPQIFPTLFPSEKFIKLSWGHVPEDIFSTYALDATSQLYRNITVKFVSIMTEAYGADLVSHFYNIDPYNEMQPDSGAPSDLAETSKRIYKHLATADEKAVWYRRCSTCNSYLSRTSVELLYFCTIPHTHRVLQGWMFYNSQDFWTYDRAKAFLTAVDVGDILVLDLMSDMTPVYDSLDSYFGQPFIWCMLNNFGGVSGFYGRIHNITHGPIAARTMLVNSSMAGIGTTMEGIDQNDAIFELVNEMSWRSEAPDVSDWFLRYATRRYGLEYICVEQKKDLQLLLSEALLELATSVWNCTTILINHGQYEIISRPSLELQPVPFWYDVTKVEHAGQLMHQAADLCTAFKQQLESSPSASAAQNSDRSNATFLYDFTDVSRQQLQIEFTQQFFKLQHDCVTGYRVSNLTCLDEAWRRMNFTFVIMEDLLGRVPGMRLDRWLRAARAQGASSNASDLFEFNARNQLTLWGPFADILDYAGKQWHGLMSHYYQPRWELFATALYDAANNNRTFNQTDFDIDVFYLVELPFTKQRLF